MHHNDIIQQKITKLLLKYTKTFIIAILSKKLLQMHKDQSNKLSKIYYIHFSFSAKGWLDIIIHIYNTIGLKK